jgi:aminoglycoside N3'-acetyltransferase
MSQTTITKADLVRDLKNSGLKKGDHISIALSFKQLGFVDGGPEKVADAFREVVGSEGTIFANAHTKSFPLCAIDKKYIFDQKTPAITGLFPNTLLKQQDALRSRHPTCSIVAIGKLAHYLTEDHNEFSRPYLPYEKLAAINGKCLFIGTDSRLVAIRHEAQHRAGLFCVPKYHGVQYRNQQGQTQIFTYMFPPCMKALGKLTLKLEENNVIQVNKVGNAPAVIGYAKDILDSTTQILLNEPENYLCDDPFCIYCRELEKSKKLYDKIENPHLFQKSLLLRHTIHLRNKIILAYINRVSLVEKNQKSFNVKAAKYVSSQIKVATSSLLNHSN